MARMSFSAEDFDEEKPGVQMAQADETKVPAQTEDPYADIEVEVESETPAAVPAETLAASVPAQQGTQLDSVVLEGDWVPENMRGMPLRQAMGLVQSLQDIASRAIAGAGQPQQTPPAQEQVEFSEDDFGIGADPKEFQSKLEKLVNQKTQPYVVSALQNAAQNNYRAVQNMPYWQLFGNEISQQMSQLDLVSQAKPEVWEYVYNRFVSANISKVIAHENSKKETAIKPEVSFTETSNPGVPPKAKKYTLTAAELRYCQGMGIDPRAYAKRKYGE